MSVAKKRSLIQKGYRIVCTIDRIEEFDIREGDATTVMLVTTETINSIHTACDINMTKGKRTIRLPGIDNIVISPDPSVKVLAMDVGGGASGVGVSIVM